MDHKRDSIRTELETSQAGNSHFLKNQNKKMQKKHINVLIYNLPAFGTAFVNINLVAKKNQTKAKCKIRKKTAGFFYSHFYFFISSKTICRILLCVKSICVFNYTFIKKNIKYHSKIKMVTLCLLYVLLIWIVVCKYLINTIK